jgi:hypothetical protein
MSLISAMQEAQIGGLQEISQDCPGKNKQTKKPKTLSEK